MGRAIRHDFEQRWRPLERPVNGSWRADETYIRVRGQWMFLYRAVDSRGRTVESHLSRKRDCAVAKAFFRRALKHHGEPRTITLDGFEPTHSALRRMGMRNEFNFRWEDPVRIRIGRCPDCSGRLLSGGNSILSNFLATVNGFLVFAIENRFERPHVFVTHDATEILLGRQHGRSRPTFRHRLVPPSAYSPGPSANSRMGVFNQVRAGQAAM